MIKELFFEAKTIDDAKNKAAAELGLDADLMTYEVVTMPQKGIFGIGAVKQENIIDLVVKIVPWDTHANYDRLGLEDQFEEILGVKVPLNIIPVTPGRNLAVILEVAAMNNRQRKQGYNAALEFTEQINRHFLEVSRQNN